MIHRKKRNKQKKALLLSPVEKEVRMQCRGWRGKPRKS